jgi:type VI secretion system protein ImpJ
MIDGAEAGPLPLRFAREASMVPEYGTGQNPVSVPWLRPNVRILFDGDAFDDYSVLPLARIVRLPNGRAALDERYVPPVLRTHASPFLVALFQQLESSISATHSALAAQRREGADMTRSDAARIVLLMLLGRALPRVADLLRSNTHPRDAYRVVSELVGGLSAIGTAGAVAIPPFNHMELGATFEALTTSALDVLEAVAAPRYRAIQVRAFDRNVRRVELREPGIFGKQFVVVVAGEDAVRIRSELSRSAKVGPDDRISTLISSAVAGIGLVPESRRPTGLAVPPGAVCFSLVQQGPLWDEVVMKGSLTFFLPDAFSGAELSLFVREPGVLE